MVRLRPRHHDSLLIAGACVPAGSAREWQPNSFSQLAGRKAIGNMFFKILLDAVDGNRACRLSMGLDGNSVCAARPLFDAILDRLFSPAPVTARAELRAVSFDWAGPLYLHSRLALAVAAL